MGEATITTMADQNQMGSDLSSVDPTTLAWAEYWYPIAWKGLLWAGGITAVGACATIGFLLLQWRTTSIREKQSEIRTSTVELQAMQARRDTALAQEHIAQLNNQTERLKADNLALQKLMQPRRLGSTIRISSLDDPDIPPDAELQFGGIKKFAGTPVLIQVVPDFEAQTLANDMVFVLGSYGWRVQIVDEAISHLSPRMISDGVQVTYTRDGKYADAAQALAESFSKAGLTGPAGWGLSHIFAQGQPVNPDRTPVETPMFPNFDKPIEAIIVLVGMKPIPPAKAAASVPK